jgi:hypothetical protein
MAAATVEAIPRFPLLIRHPGVPTMVAGTMAIAPLDAAAARQEGVAVVALPLVDVVVDPRHPTLAGKSPALLVAAKFASRKGIMLQIVGITSMVTMFLMRSTSTPPSMCMAVTMPGTLIREPRITSPTSLTS